MLLNILQCRGQCRPPPQEKLSSPKCQWCQGWNPWLKECYLNGKISGIRQRRSLSEGRQEREWYSFSQSIYHKALIRPWLCTELCGKGWQGKRRVPVVILREKVDGECVLLFPLLWGPSQLNVKGVCLWICFSALFSVPQSICWSLCQHRPMSGAVAPQYYWLFRRQVLPLCPSLGPLHIQVHFRICRSSSRIEKKGPCWDSDWNFIEFVDQLGG